MTFIRMYHSIRLFMIRSQVKKAEYLRSHNIFAQMGMECSTGWRLVPLYPELIRIGNNVVFHRTTKLIPHDGINDFLKKANPKADYGHGERLLPIEIGNNVSFSYNTIVTGGVKIGNNVLVTAGTVIDSDIPNNSIVSGVPAKVVGKFSAFSLVRQMQKEDNIPFVNQHLSSDDIARAWNKFDSKRVIK